MQRYSRDDTTCKTTAATNTPRTSNISSAAAHTTPTNPAHMLSSSEIESAATNWCSGTRRGIEVARTVYNTRVASNKSPNVAKPIHSRCVTAETIAPRVSTARTSCPTTSSCWRKKRSATKPATGPTKSSGNAAMASPRRNASVVSSGFRSKSSTCANPSDVIASATCEIPCPLIAMRKSRAASTSRRRTCCLAVARRM